MGTGTNSERILQNNSILEQNNARIAQAIEKAENLPEYQDIEPIYTTSLPTLVSTQRNLSADRGVNDISYVGEYYCRWYYNNSFYYLEVKKGTTTIYSASEISNYRCSGAMLYEDDEYVYFARSGGSSKGIKLGKISKADNSVTLENISMSNTTKNIMRLEYNLLYIDGKIYKLDFDNKSAVELPYSSGYCKSYTSDFITNTTYKSLYEIATNKTYAYDNKVTFINAAGNKIMLGNNLHVLTVDRTIGELLKENVLDFYVDKGAIAHLYGNYYIYSPKGLDGGEYNSFKGNTGYLLEFNESSNNFIIIQALYNLSSTNTYNYGDGGIGNGGRQWFFSDASTTYMQYFYGYDEDKKDILGYKKDGKLLYQLPQLTSTSGKVLEGVQVLDDQFKVVIGTIPNNREINITPSTEAQTIPVGYTSGGTVQAVTALIDANITPDNIKAGVTILGVEGNVEPDKPDQEKEVTPTTEIQEVFGDTGYELGKVTVKAVDANIDTNIIAENIKEGITILGVTGSLKTSEDLEEVLNSQEELIQNQQATINAQQEAIRQLNEMLEARTLGFSQESADTIEGILGENE